jgi:hypothetical protein
MASKKHTFIAAVLLVILLGVNLLNVQVVLADGETPTEPPVATQVASEQPTEPPVESTPGPVEETATPVPAGSETSSAVASPEPVEAESTPVAGILSDVPEDTSIVVLDQSGQPVALGTQETADAVVNSDPIWCPAGVTPPTPGVNGCSASFPSITALLTAMRTDPTSYDQDGTIFLEVLGGAGFTTPLILDDSPTSLAGSFGTLSVYNLTVKGGWNPGAGTVTGTQSLFGVSGGNQGYILIGSLVNPWVGSVTLRDIEVRDVTAANSVSIYTSSGSILLDDTDVAQQAGDKYLAYLHSQSGNITVENGSNFDGNDAGTGINESKGFYAETGTGAITISSSSGAYTFKDNEGTDPDAHNGATLSAPTITLNDVIARANDGNGIEILNANLVTLNNVTSSVNQAGGSGNGLSGVLVLGNGSTVVNVNGGVYAKNGRYGIEVYNGTLVIVGTPTCPTTGNTANGLGCYNVVPPTVVPTQPTPTQPTPTQPTPTQPTPIEPTPTGVTPTPPTVVPTEITATPSAPAPTPSGPAATEPSNGSSSSTGSSNSQSGSQGFVVPLTGGQLIDLNCNTVLTVFGIKLSFFNLCEQQTSIRGVGVNDLPAALPDGFSFVVGLDLSILTNGQAVDSLPDGTGIEMDFPAGAADQFAVLYWDESKGEWMEVSQEMAQDKVSEALSGSGPGLYHLTGNSLDSIYPVLTTDKTGTFVLVKK